MGKEGMWKNRAKWNIVSKKYIQVQTRSLTNSYNLDRLLTAFKSNAPQQQLLIATMCVSVSQLQLKMIANDKTNYISMKSSNSKWPCSFKGDLTDGKAHRILSFEIGRPGSSEKFRTAKMLHPSAVPGNSTPSCGTHKCCKSTPTPVPFVRMSRLGPPPAAHPNTCTRLDHGKSISLYWLEHDAGVISFHPRGLLKSNV